MQGYARAVAPAEVAGSRSAGVPARVRPLRSSRQRGRVQVARHTPEPVMEVVQAWPLGPPRLQLEVARRWHMQQPTCSGGHTGPPQLHLEMAQGWPLRRPLGQVRLRRQLEVMRRCPLGLPLGQVLPGHARNQPPRPATASPELVRVNRHWITLPRVNRHWPWGCGFVRVNRHWHGAGRGLLNRHRPWRNTYAPESE